jgi:hypothetical protein
MWVKSKRFIRGATRPGRSTNLVETGRDGSVVPVFRRTIWSSTSRANGLKGRCRTPGLAVEIRWPGRAPSPNCYRSCEVDPNLVDKAPQLMQWFNHRAFHV